MKERAKKVEKEVGKSVVIKSSATINPGEIKFGRSVEEKLFNKKEI